MKCFKHLLVICTLMFSVTCYASDISVMIDSRIIEFDVQSIILNERTLVPMRKIFEELGCSIEWLAETQTVLATKNSKIMALQVGKNKIISTDIETGITEVKEIDISPIIYNDRTLIPVRAISELLGYTVEWDSEEFVVNIFTQ